MKARITIVVNDLADGPALLAEHGWSVWVEYGKRSVLLDTGQGQALARNAAALSRPWSALEAVLLSHGHYDHTGGLTTALKATKHPAVYAHPAAWRPKYACTPEGRSRDIGTSSQLAALAARETGRFVETTRPTEVMPGLWLTGPIPRRTYFEDVGGPFYQDPDCLRPDDLPDDQALVLEIRRGLVVILGCAHAGVINTLEYIRALRPGLAFRAVIGGMHLLHAGEERLNLTLAGLERLDVAHLVPAHCTGAGPQAMLQERFGRRCEEGRAGLSWVY